MQSEKSILCKHVSRKVCKFAYVDDEKMVPCIHNTEKHTLFPTKMVKINMLFQKKPLKNHILWGRTYLYSYPSGSANT